MSIRMKCDAKTRPSRIPNRSRHSSIPVIRANRANPSEIEPDEPRQSRLTFVEDFTREHSFLGVHIASMELSGCF